jgi:hypothetical protein
MTRAVYLRNHIGTKSVRLVHVETAPSTSVHNHPTEWAAFTRFLFLGIQEKNLLPAIG